MFMFHNEVPRRQFNKQSQFKADTGLFTIGLLIGIVGSFIIMMTIVSLVTHNNQKVLTQWNNYMLIASVIIGVVGSYIGVEIYCRKLYPTMTIPQYINYLDWKNFIPTMGYAIFNQPDVLVTDMITKENHIKILVNLNQPIAIQDQQKLNRYLNKIQQCANQNPGRYTQIDIYSTFDLNPEPIDIVKIP